MTDQQLDPVTAAIAAAPLGEYLGPEGSAVLAGYADGERSLAAGEHLFHRGASPEAFYLLTQGRLAVEREPGRVVHVLEKGDLVGELSFIDGTPHTQSVRALEDATVLTFVIDDVTPLIAGHPRVMFDFMRAVIARAHQTTAAIGRERQELADFITRGGRRT
jgi:CRP-like cAMP-binding protein